MKDALGYNEFLKFASDFDLSNSVILSTLELGDIYLSSIKVRSAAMKPPHHSSTLCSILLPASFLPSHVRQQPVDGDTTIRKLTFVEFWEAIVRAALVAYSKVRPAEIHFNNVSSH